MINGDSSKWKVTVEVQDRVYDSINETLTDEWKTVKAFPLDNPGQLSTECITSTRRIIIRESGPQL